MKKILKIALAVIIILILMCLISIWVSYNWLTVSYFTVTDSKISRPFRIILISDLHDHQFGSGNDRLIERIQEPAPDLIIVDGDMINGNSDNDDVAVELVSLLKDIAPVYYSYGNQEYDYMEAGYDDLQNHLEEAGAVVLNYQSLDIEVKGNPIRLWGTI